MGSYSAPCLSRGGTMRSSMLDRSFARRLPAIEHQLPALDTVSDRIRPLLQILPALSAGVSNVGRRRVRRSRRIHDRIHVVLDLGTTKLRVRLFPYFRAL